ncbi:MAG: hypothetical protein IJ234_11315 [Clostridia bacterium]|nr:hypothetical protein [Clostridia bacterium]
MRKWMILALAGLLMLLSAVSFAEPTATPMPQLPLDYLNGVLAQGGLPDSGFIVGYKEDGVTPIVITTETIYDTWYLQRVLAGSLSMNAADMGIATTATFLGDGTMVLESDGERETYTWTQDALNITAISVSDAEDVLNFTFNENIELVLESDDVQMIFFNEEPMPSEKVETVENADASAFDGTWTLTTVSMMGAEFPSAQIGMEYSLVIGNGEAQVTIKSEDEDEATTIILPTEFQDGTLVLNIEDETNTFTLREDGKLVSTQGDSTLTIDFIFEREE